MWVLIEFEWREAVHVGLAEQIFGGMRESGCQRVLTRRGDIASNCTASTPRSHDLFGFNRQRISLSDVGSLSLTGSWYRTENFPVLSSKLIFKVVLKKLTFIFSKV
jgi:hypothetical protein